MACTIVGFCKAEVKDQVKKPSPYSDVTAVAKVGLHLYCTGLDKQNFQGKIVNNFLPINFNMCCGCCKEPSH